jgi:CBS domain containing-hemolysin-like protein
MDLVWSLLVVAALVFANGFFVAAEFALVTVRRTRIEQLAAEGSGAARAVQKAVGDLDRYIAGTQVGITIASLALGWVGEPAVARLLEPFLVRIAPQIAEASVHGFAVAVGFSLVTFLHVILGELVPKSLALQKPESTSLAIARPMAAIVLLLRPLIWSLNGLGGLLLRFLGLDAGGKEMSVHSARELELLVRQSHAAGEIDDLERRMIQKTFHFSETAVGNLMVPRSEVTGLDLDQTPDEIIATAVAANHTRLPAYRGSLDHVEGVVYINDLFRLVRESRGEAVDVRKILRTALFVPETLHLDEVLDRFRRNHTQMAIVVDEYGGTAGVVTLEDVVESVFGEIQDQNEDAKPPIVRGKDGVLTVRGDTRLMELTELLGDVFKGADADTIAGYVMYRLNRIAKVGDVVDNSAFSIRVSGMDRQRIVEVVITPRQR